MLVIGEGQPALFRLLRVILLLVRIADLLSEETRWPFRRCELREEGLMLGLIVLTRLRQASLMLRQLVSCLAAVHAAKHRCHLGERLRHERFRILFRFHLGQFLVVLFNVLFELDIAGYLFLRVRVVVSLLDFFEHEGES